MASISITAPSSAKEGEKVSVSAQVTNTLDHHGTFKTEIFAVPDLSPAYIIGSFEEVILSGVSKTYSASFTMPDCNTTILVWVERWQMPRWTYYGSAGKVVSLEVIQYKGKIVSKELEYDGIKKPIPVYYVPVGSTGKVYVEGRNDMATSQRMGIVWRIKDSDGWTPPNGEYSAWELWPHPGPGETHTFVGPTFNIDKIGTWMIEILLYMNPEDPVLVDSYDGILFVGEVAVPEYRGTIISMELKYDSVRGDIPVY